MRTMFNQIRMSWLRWAYRRRLHPARTQPPVGCTPALHRVAGDAEPTYAAVINGMRNSDAVAADETGWRNNGENSALPFIVHMPG